MATKVIKFPTSRRRKTKLARNVPSKAVKRPQGGGARAWKPSARDRHYIKIALGGGFTQEAVARIMGVSLSTLQRRCPEELESGAEQVNSKVVNKLFQKVLKGDTIAMLFWCKSRMGWRETSRTEHTGADGGAIKHETVTAEAAAFRQKIETMAERAKITAAAANDKVPAETEGEEPCSLSS